MKRRAIKKPTAAAALACPETHDAEQPLDLSLFHRGDEHSRRFGEKPPRLGPAETPSDWVTTSTPVSARFTVVISSGSPGIFSNLGWSTGILRADRTNARTSRLEGGVHGLKAVWRIPPHVFTTPSPSARRLVRLKPMTCAAVRSRSGLFVDYRSDRATRRGSCILIHIWSAPDTGTAGCIGLPEERVRALQDFSRAGAVLAVLPETALERFPGCLPAAIVRPPALTSANR